MIMNSLRSNPGLELANAFGVMSKTLLSEQREHAAGVPEEHSISLFESSLAAVR